jgi:hypothetical protein
MKVITHDLNYGNTGCGDTKLERFLKESTYPKEIIDF